MDCFGIAERNGDDELGDWADGGAFDAGDEVFLAHGRVGAFFGWKGAEGDGAGDSGLPVEEVGLVGEFVGFVEQDEVLGALVVVVVFAFAFGLVGFFCFALLDFGEEFVEGGEDGFVVELDGGVGDVEKDEDEIGVHGFFEGCAEGGDEVVREVADEADGVGEHGVVAAAEVPFAGAGHECGEDAVVGVGAAFGEGVEEGGLAGVGVSDEAYGEVVGVSFFDGSAFAGLDVFEFTTEDCFSALDESAVDFELLFAWASCAYATDAAGADDAFEVGPHGAESWVGVFELGDFDLEFGFVGDGTGSEDVEDEFGAVEDFAVGVFFDFGDLSWGEVVVEDDGARVELGACVFEFFEFAFAHVGARDGALEALFGFADDDGTGLDGEFAEFAEGIALVVGGFWEADSGEHGTLGLDFDGLSVGGFGHRGDCRREEDVYHRGHSGHREEKKEKIFERRGGAKTAKGAEKIF